MFPCQTLLSDLFLLLVTDFSHLSLSLSLITLCLPNPSACLSFTESLTASFCCHSTLVIRLSVLIMALLIIVHQIIIQTFHSDEVRGVISVVLSDMPPVLLVPPAWIVDHSSCQESQHCHWESIILRCYTDWLHTTALQSLAWYAYWLLVATVDSKWCQKIIFLLAYFKVRISTQHVFAAAASRCSLQFFNSQFKSLPFLAIVLVKSRLFFRLFSPCFLHCVYVFVSVPLCECLCLSAVRPWTQM